MPTLVENGYKIFTDVDGEPLENGYIFIGVAGLNPLSNPLQAYWDAALTNPASNIRTKGGYPDNNGTPGRLYVPTNYSIIVKDKHNATVYTLLDSVDYFNSPSGEVLQKVDTIADLRGLLVTDQGYLVATGGYYVAGDGAAALYSWDQGSTDADNGGSIIRPTAIAAIDPGRFLLSLSETTAVKLFGAVGDGVTDDTTAIKNAVASDLDLTFRGGTFLILEYIPFSKSNKIYIGENGSLLYGGDTTSRLAWITGTNITFRNLVFDGNASQPRSGLVYVETAANDLTFDSCIFQNIDASLKGLVVLNATYGLLVSPYSVERLNINNCTFKNLLTHNDASTGGPIEGEGFVGGICFMPEDLTAPVAVQTIVTQCNIVGSVFDNIRTILPVGQTYAQRAIYEDADAIRTFAQAAGADKIYLNVYSCTFRAISKRCFKTRVSGVKIKDIVVYPKSEEYPTLIIFDLGNGGSIDGVHVDNDAASQVWTISQMRNTGEQPNTGSIISNVKIGNCAYGFQVFVTAAAETLENFHFDNITIEECEILGYRFVAGGTATPILCQNITVSNSSIRGTENDTRAFEVLPDASDSCGFTLTDMFIENADCYFQGEDLNINNLSIEMNRATYSGANPTQSLLHVSANGHKLSNVKIDVSAISATYLSATRSRLIYLKGNNSIVKGLDLIVPDSLTIVYAHLVITGISTNLDGFTYYGLGRNAFTDLAETSGPAILRNLARTNIGVSTTSFIYVNNGNATNVIIDGVVDLANTNDYTIEILAGVRFEVYNVASRTTNVTIVQSGGIANQVNINSLL